MSLTIQKLFSPVVLPTAAAGDIYVAPATPSTLTVKNMRIRLVNTTAASVAVTLYNVPSGGGAAAAANMSLDQKSIAAHDYLDIDIPTLAAGDKLQGFSSVAGVTVHEMGGNIWA